MFKRKNFKSNLMLPAWANKLIEYNFKWVVHAICIVFIPLYFLLYGNDAINQIESDREQINRT